MQENISDVAFVYVNKNDSNELLPIAKLLQAQGQYHDQFYLEQSARRHPSLNEIREYVEKAYKDDDSYVIVKCIANGIVIGFAICQIIENIRPWHPDFREKTWIINELHVSAKARGNGIGKKFLEFLVEQAQQAGCASVELICMADNEPTLGFYDSVGFTTTTNYYSLHKIL